MKYIVFMQKIEGIETRLMSVLFDEHFVHRDIAKGIDLHGTIETRDLGDVTTYQAVSAGFYNPSTHTCSGKSDSLGLKSEPMRDAHIIRSGIRHIEPEAPVPTGPAISEHNKSVLRRTFDPNTLVVISYILEHRVNLDGQAVDVEAITLVANGKQVSISPMQGFRIGDAFVVQADGSLRDMPR